MAIGDPFSTTYEGARKGFGAYGEAISGIAEYLAERKQKEREMQAKETELLATLVTKGIFPTAGLPQEPQTISDYQGLAQAQGRKLWAKSPDTAQRLLQASGITAQDRPETFAIKGLGEFYQGETPTLKRVPTEEEEIAAAEAKARPVQIKKKKEAEVNFEVARNKLRVTVAAFKAMQEKAGGEGLLPAASAVFGGTRLGRALGVNPYSQAYKGQLVEAASALAKLAAPSARVGQEIIEQFKQTLPDVWSISNPGEFQNQIRFSLHNAFGTAMGNAEIPYTQDLRTKVDEMVNELIDVPAMSLEDLEKIQKGELVEESRYAPQYKIGQTITKNGKTYKYIGNEEWEY